MLRDTAHIDQVHRAVHQRQRRIARERDGLGVAEDHDTVGVGAQADEAIAGLVDYHDDAVGGAHGPLLETLGARRREEEAVDPATLPQTQGCGVILVQVEHHGDAGRTTGLHG